MAGRKFAPNTALVFDDGSVTPANSARFHCPESLHAIGEHLAELVSERIRNPGWFNATVPLLVEQIIDFFDVIHTMHEQALRVLADYSQHQKPYCLYLRSFSAGGYRGEEPQWPGETLPLGLSAGDRDFREYISDRLDGLLPVISCFNTLDLFSVASVRQSTKPRPAMVRLLSHNWKRTVAALIDNARMIVLQISPSMHGNATAGVSTEMMYMHKLGQTQRCLLVLDADRPVPRHGTFDFRAAFGWPAAKADPEFTAELKALATDEFQRQSLQPTFPELPCYVVDRNIEPALEQFRDDDISALNYTDLIPGCLRPNIEMISTDYPEMMKRWMAVEERLKSSNQLSQQELSQALFIALFCFVLATTLEHYEPMARSIVQVGLAHGALTRDTTFGRTCFAGAAKFARWGGMEELAAYFAEGAANMPAPDKA